MIYLDANVIIRMVEGDALARKPLETRLAGSRHKANSMGTSRLARLECLVKPLREKDGLTVHLFERFFSGVELQLLEIDSSVIERATVLRASYSFKTPDAIHLATAILGGASVFLTGDHKLANCKEVVVELL